MNIQLSQLSLIHKLILTLFLIIMGVSYLFAALNLQLKVSLADGEKGLSVRDIEYTYRGDPGVTLLEAMIRTSMKQYLPSPDAALDIEQWIADGKTRGDYEQIRWIFEQKCVRCHKPSGEANFRPLTDYEEVAAAATPQKRSITSLASFSHYHAFGMGLFSIVMALIFSFSSFSIRIRMIVCCLPFVALLMDVGSWWLTRLISPIFAYTVLPSGGLMGLAFILLIVGPLFDMWRRRDAVNS